ALVSELELQGAVTGEGPQLRSLLVRSDVGSVDAAPKERDVVSLKGEIDLARLAALVNTLPSLRGRLAVAGTARAGLRSPEGEAAVTVDRPGYDAFVAERVTAEIHLTASKVEGRDLDLRAGGATVTG